MSFWSMLLAACVALWLAFAGATLLDDADTYWHVAAGQWIIDQGQVPETDPFSHSFAGQPWTAHEWLAEVVLALSHDAAGWSAVVLLSILCIAFSLAWLLRYLLRHLPPLYALLLTILALMLSSSHLLARPHVLAMPLMLLWCVEIATARDRGRLPGWWLLPVMLLWANLHGGFTIGLVFAGLLALEAILAAPSVDRGPVFRGWLLFGLAAGLVSLITPHGIHGPLFTLQILGDSAARDFIIEWQPPALSRPHPLWLWLPLAVLALLRWRPRFSLPRLVLLAGLVYLALRHERSGELLGILGAILLAAPLGNKLNKMAAESGLDRLFQRLARPLASGAATAALFLVIVGVLGLLYWRPPSPAAANTPTDALQTAQQAGLNGPVFNYYDFGGYLIYRGVAPFIDGRADMYGGEFCRRHVRMVLGAAKTPEVEQVMAQHGITWTLLPPDVPMINWLDQQPDWQRLHADDIAVVHQRIGTGSAP